MKRTGFTGYIYDFNVDYDVTDIDKKSTGVTKSASWNDKLDQDVLWYLYNRADTLKSDSN